MATSESIKQSIESGLACRHVEVTATASTGRR